MQTNKKNRAWMADFTFKKPGNWRYPQFPVEPSHIGEGRVRVDVSFASFLCAREKEGKNGYRKEKIFIFLFMKKEGRIFL